MHWDGERLYMSAPASGTLASVAGDGPLLTEEIGQGMGTALHTHQGTLYISQSMAQDGMGVLPDGSTGQGAAGRAQLSMGGHLALNGLGIWRDGVHQDLNVWGSALVAFDGEWVVSASQGDEVLVSESGVRLTRVRPYDEAGAAMVACDLDGDGAEELILGAPGAGQIYIYASLSEAPRVLGPESGRFGQSLACGAQGLAVGAPMESEGQGAVYALEGDELTRIYAGAGHAGSQLLAAEEGLFVAETGGSAAEPGLVLRLY